jgi:hypothetical protein
MSWVAVETVGDDAAAAVLAEALGAHQIATQLRRLPGTPYGPAKLEIEVRVRPDDLGRARAVLAFISEEASAAALAEAEGPSEAAAAPAPPRRLPRSVWVGAALVLLFAMLLLYFG